MEWLKYIWLESGDDACVYFHEVDDDRWEIRRVEVFPDGRRLCLTQSDLENAGALEIVQIPTVDEIDSDPEFEARSISADAFEAEWGRGDEAG